MKLRGGWWLKVSVGQQQMKILGTLWCTTHRKISVFTTPETSFYIRNQDPLLTDIHLLLGTFFLPPKLGTTCSIKCFSEKKNMYNFCIVYVYYCWTVYNVRVQLFDHVKCLVVLLNASLKDDDDSKRQVKSSYCAANKLQGIFDQCSSALKKLYFVPILCQCILANGGANTRSLVRSTYALHTIKPSELCFTYPEMYEFANTKLSIVSRLLIPC